MLENLVAEDMLGGDAFETTIPKAPAASGVGARVRGTAT